MIGDRRMAEQVDPALWQRPDMRVALAARDIAAVFRLLQRVGVSQRRIAALTGQSQSEISEILGGRHVVSYEVLARIADGLDVPRGHLGLAYDETTAQLVGVAPGPGEGEEDSGPLLARVTALTVGDAVVDERSWAHPVLTPLAPAPDHVGIVDVTRLENITAKLRAMDHQYGGGACRDAVVAQLAWAHQLLRAQVSDNAARALHLAVSDLHILAGWTSFDVGMVASARRHLYRALEHARYVNEASLVAKALYGLGRVHLHHGWSGQALRLLQLGQVTAQQSGSGRAMAMMQANLAWVHAVMGDNRQALSSIDRARDEYVRAENEEAPPWLVFFDSAELHALRGTALAHLPEPTSQQRSEAIERFTLSTTLRELPMARSRAFELTGLSWLLFDEGAVEQAVRIGNEAVDIAEQVRSRRILERFEPLRERVAKRLDDTSVRDLAARLHAARPTRPTPS